jgi:hypothetical protein
LSAWGEFFHASSNGAATVSGNSGQVSGSGQAWVGAVTGASSTGDSGVWAQAESNTRASPKITTNMNFNVDFVFINLSSIEYKIEFGKAIYVFGHLHD